MALRHLQDFFVSAVPSDSAFNSSQDCSLSDFNKYPVEYWGYLLFDLDTLVLQYPSYCRLNMPGTTILWEPIWKQTPESGCIGRAHLKLFRVQTPDATWFLPPKVTAVAFHTNKFARPCNTEPGRCSFVGLKLWHHQAPFVAE